jgi:hypothetical protein
MIVALMEIGQSPRKHCREHSIVHDPLFNGPSSMGWMSPDTDESMSPLVKIVSSQSSIGFGRTESKTHERGDQTYSKVRKFIRSSTFERADPNRKYTTRKAVIANTKSASRENSSGFELRRIGLCNRTDFESP